MTGNRNFPAEYFLDHEAFRKDYNITPTVDFDLAPSIADSIGNSISILTSYSEKVHWWMPIISKRHLLDTLQDPEAKLSADTRLLLLTMKILLWRASEHANESPRTRAYITVKGVIHEVVSAGVLTLRLLQAQLLLTIYELGHGIYPAAYLSLGACSRYGIALQADKSIYPNTTYVDMREMEIEERRRSWWAVLILDR
jgi:hypothetical protein